MADVVIRGVTYTGVDTVSIPADGGGTETFMQPSGAISITENGVVDVTNYASAAVNVSGGGGAPSASDAILLVTAPANSVVTMTKGVDTRVPTIWLQAADPTMETALFVIEAADFDQTAWTVTATLNGRSETDTIIVSAALQYNVQLPFGTLIYYRGDEVTTITNGWALAARSGWNGQLTKNPNEMIFSNSYVSGNHFAYGFLRANNKISVADYNTVRIKVTAYSNTAPAVIPCYLLARNNDSAVIGSAGSLSSDVVAYQEIDNIGTFNLNVGSLTSSYYIGVGFANGNSNANGSVTISEIALM